MGVMMKHMFIGGTRQLGLALLALLGLFPIYYIAVNSLKSQSEYARNQLAPPILFQFENYASAWSQVAGPLLNTIVIVGVSVIGILVCSALSAYAFAVLPFPGKRGLFMLVFILLLIPSFLTLIPLFLQIKRLPFANTYWALILPYIAAGQAFSIFVLRTFFAGISKELLEAARIDGAGDVRIFRSVAVPLSLPVLISVGIINLVPLWNDYLLPRLILNRAHQTVTMALVAFQGSAQTHTAPNFGALMAAYVLASLPLVVLFSFLMRYYIEGLTSGSVKM